MSIKIWTPREVVTKLSAFYGPSQWRPHGDPITELVLTILSQHTSDTNSGRAFMRLRERFQTWEAVLAAPVRDLVDAIRLGGLAAQKAPRIKAALSEIVERTGGFDLASLRTMPLEEARSWLTSLPGVGPKTAACILLFALGRPALPVDTHVYRVAKRLGLVPQGMNVGKAHSHLEKIVPAKLHYAFHISLIKHGRRLCRAQRPFCAQCPLLRRCPEGQARLDSGDFAEAALGEAFAEG